MLDIRLIREDPATVRANLERRGLPEKLHLLDEVLAKDLEWRRLLQEADALKHRRNVLSKEIAELKRTGKDAVALQREAATLPGDLEGKAKLVDVLRTEIDGHLLRLPNLLHESVPAGKTAADNVEVRRWGEPKRPEFELRPHGDLLEAAGLADFERARKAAGAGFVYLLGDLVLLDQALIQFALHELVKNGYTPVFPPFLLRREAYQGMVDLSAFEEVMYKIEGEDLYMIATSEHPIGAMFQGEILDEDRLPMRFAGYSTNFRKEIGGHGVDTKGLFRMHQFNKVEQFAFCVPEDSWRIHEEMMAVTEGLFQKLGLPYRIITLCSADTGLVMAKTYDMEAWFPRQGAYAEVASISNAVDYQARRLNIRVGKHGGEKRVAHTLNGTAIATSRALVAILENHQNTDGTVTVPEVLRPFMGGRQVIGAPKA